MTKTPMLPDLDKSSSLDQKYGYAATDLDIAWYVGRARLLLLSGFAVSLTMYPADPLPVQYFAGAGGPTGTGQKGSRNWESLEQLWLSRWYSTTATLERMWVAKSLAPMMGVPPAFPASLPRCDPRQSRPPGALIAIEKPSRNGDCHPWHLISHPLYANRGRRCQDIP